MTHLIILLTVLLVLLFILVLSTILTVFPNFKYYKIIYDKLDSYTFYKYGNHLYVHAWNEEGDDFVWFLNDEHPHLTQQHYIHPGSLTYFSPYSWYWLIKYRKYFKNLDPSRIKSF